MKPLSECFFLGENKKRFFCSCWEFVFVVSGLVRYIECDKWKKKIKYVRNKKEKKQDPRKT